jgi:hypothetical protein
LNVASRQEENDQLLPHTTENKLTLGLLVEVSEVLPLLLVDDGEDSGNGLSDSVAGCQLPLSSFSSWVHSALPSFPLGLDLLHSVDKHISQFLAHTIRRPAHLPVQSSPFFLHHRSFRRILAQLVFVDRSLSLAHLHLGQLGSGATSDLLNPQRSELSLELVELSHEVLLVPIY